MFELARFDCIIVPLATDSMILNLHYKTTKFVSLSEIFFQDTFIFIPKLHLTLMEEKMLKKFCSGKKIGFVQLPKIYETISMFLMDLSCQMIFMQSKAIDIKKQHICKNLLEEYELIQQLEISSREQSSVSDKDHEQSANKATSASYMTGIDHNMLKMLMPDRRLICTLWETEYGQHLYRMARYLFYYDDQLKDEYILSRIPVSDIEALNSLREFANVLSPEALFTEQIKLLGGTHELIGSFVRFATLHYQQVHAHYLTLLSLFLKHKYCMYPMVVNPIYPIHVLRFFEQDLLLAGFTEKDEYYDFTLQTLYTGNALSLIHTSQYIEQIANDIRINFDQDDEVANKAVAIVIEPEPTYAIARIIPKKQDAYDVSAFLSIINPTDVEKEKTDENLSKVLYKIFDLFVSKQDVSEAYQELGAFESSLAKNMYQSLLYVYEDLLNDLHISPLAIQKQYTKTYIKESVLEYSVHLLSSHYYIYVNNAVYIFFTAFNCQKTLSNSSLVRIYLAYQYWNDFLSQMHREYTIKIYYINLEGYKEIEYATLLKACKGYLKYVFKLEAT